MSGQCSFRYRRSSYRSGVSGPLSDTLTSTRWKPGRGKPRQIPPFFLAVGHAEEVAQVDVGDVDPDLVERHPQRDDLAILVLKAFEDRPPASPRTGVIRG
jgi:hypothetical protein